MKLDKDFPIKTNCFFYIQQNRFRIGGMGGGFPMMGMMGGPPPGLLQKKKEEAQKAAEEEAEASGKPLGSMNHSTIRSRARGPGLFFKLFLCVLIYLLFIIFPLLFSG